MWDRINKAINKIDRLKCFTKNSETKRAARKTLFALKEEYHKHLYCLDEPPAPAPETNPVLVAMVEKIEAMEEIKIEW